MHTAIDMDHRLDEVTDPDKYEKLVVSANECA
jgi:hypothetical protein